MGGKLQTSLARAPAFPRSRTVMLGSFLGNGFVCPSCVTLGSRVTSTERTSAGFAHTGASFIGAPAWPAAGVPDVFPPVPACPQPASTAVAMITNPALTATVIRLLRFNKVVIPLRRPVQGGGSFQFLRLPTSFGHADQFGRANRVLRR